jgi:histidinol-phosphate aminotransferase
MLEPRQAVQKLREYHPPLAGRQGLRLDFNENTEGCSPRVLQRIREMTAEDLCRYPEREPVEQKVAEHFGLAARQVLLTNGVDEAIHLLCETYLEPDAEAVVVTPTFGMYEVFAGATGAKTIRAQAQAEFGFPLAATLAAISAETRLIAVASPNNPTGSAATREAILQVCAAAPDAAVLVDEAYYDFHGTTMLGELASTPNLFVARTFSKAYGLAGLRLGILAGAPDQMGSVRRVSSPYNVNAVALLALPVALDDHEYISSYVAQVREGRTHLETMIRRLGIRYWPSQANFLLLDIGARHREFVSTMRQRGILVRDRSSDPGCDGCVRITVGTTKQMDEVLPALEQVLAELGLVRAVHA